MHQFILSGFGDEIDPQLSRQLSVLSANGMEYLELRSVDGKNISEFPAAETGALRSQLQDAGFRVSSVASPIGKINLQDDFQKHLDMFRNTLDVAERLEAPYIRIFSFYLPEGSKPEDCRAEVLERMNALCEEAKGRPVRLLHENELGIYGDTPECCLDLLQTLGPDRIGAVFDPANFVNLSEKTEVYPHAWHLLKPYVEYMHIKDAAYRDDPKSKHDIRPAGYGEGHIPEILAELCGQGYRGFLSVEPHLGYFKGFELLERRGVNPGMPLSGPETFSIAADALRNILDRLSRS